MKKRKLSMILALALSASMVFGCTAFAAEADDTKEEEEEIKEEEKEDKEEEKEAKEEDKEEEKVEKEEDKEEIAEEKAEVDEEKAEEDLAEGEDFKAKIEELKEKRQDKKAERAEKKAEKAAEKEGAKVVQYSSDEDYTTYYVDMCMQAGYQFYNANTSGMMTIHAGVGYIDPLGEGYYYAGIGFDESEENAEDIYVSDWMDANWGCSLFCVYSLPDGDIYTWDGIYGANAKDMANYMTEGEDPYYTEDEVNGSMATRGDALINVVVGGTGAYKGASGILIGCTSGGGTYDTVDGMTLPQSLFKLMSGYIKVPNEAPETTSTHEVTEALSEDHSDLNALPNDYALVNVELRLQSGAMEDANDPEGGVGTMLPFNAQAMTSNAGNDLAEAADYNVSDYCNENWLDVYGDPTFIEYHIDDGTVAGDMYGYEFDYATIVDESSEQAEYGSESAAFVLIVDGTEDFEGSTGMLVGHVLTTDPSELWGFNGTTYDSDKAISEMTLLEGYLKVPASSAVVTSGNYANDTITDD